MERSNFFCDLCEKGYDFRSWFDRHLASAGHRRLAEMQNLTFPCPSDGSGDIREEEPSLATVYLQQSSDVIVFT